MKKINLKLKDNRNYDIIIKQNGLESFSEIKDYFSHNRGLGFEYGYIFPGMNRVLQAAGRVIRSEYDRGAILLIGERFAYAPYRHILPEEWNPDRVNHPQVIEDVLSGFWKR